MANETFPSRSNPGVGSRGTSSETPDAGSKLQETISNLGTQAAEVGDKVYRQAAEASRYVGRQVDEQPWVAVLAVGVIGFLLGALVGRATVEQPARSLRRYAEDYTPRRMQR